MPCSACNIDYEFSTLVFFNYLFSLLIYVSLQKTSYKHVFDVSVTNGDLHMM